MDEKKVSYEVPKEFTVEYAGAGDDLPISFRVIVDAERMLIVLYSVLPFRFPEDKIIDAALATVLINDDLVDGSFDLDIEDGTVCFRQTNTYCESLISAEAVSFMMDLAIHMVDLFNDKLYVLAKGMVNLQQFAESLSNQ